MTTQRITIEDFRRIGECHYGIGGYTPAINPVKLRVSRNSSSVQLWDHALTDDEAKREYEPERISINKTTHRVRFENETESSVDVVIEAKE